MKVLSIIFAILVAIVIIAFIGWSRAPDMLADHLSKMMKVSVRIQDLHLSMSNIGIDRFEIGNPKGYNLTPRAFSADTINIMAPIKRYLDQHIVIEEMLIENVYLGLEFDKKGSKKGNWTVIMKNFNKSKHDENPNKSKKAKTVLIKTVILTNINIDLAFANEGKVQHLKPTPKLVLRNVSSEKGIPTDEITNIIMKQMLDSIFSGENLQNMIEGILQDPNSAPQELLKPFKNLFNTQQTEEECSCA